MFTSNFTKPKCQNVGSIRDFKFVPVSFVSDMVINELDGILLEINLSVGLEWLTGYSTIEKRIVDESSEDTDNGTIFKPVFAGFFPGYNYLIEKLFTHMASGRFILDIIDNNGERYVLGRVENGMNFSWKHSTGTAPKSLQGYSFRFYQDSQYPKLRYNEGVAVPFPDVL